MKGYLLDVNVLIALAWPNHAHHSKAHAWFAKERSAGWGTCMVTQMAFVRISSHPSVEHHVSTQEALRKLQEIVSLPGHAFWSEPPEGYSHNGFSKTAPNTLTHGLVTDGYLATVAACHGGKLATFDRQLSRIFGSILTITSQ